MIVVLSSWHSKLWQTLLHHETSVTQQPHKLLSNRSTHSKRPQCQIHQALQTYALVYTYVQKTWLRLHYHDSNAHIFNSHTVHYVLSITTKCSLRQPMHVHKIACIDMASPRLPHLQHYVNGCTYRLHRESYSTAQHPHVFLQKSAQQCYLYQTIQTSAPIYPCLEWSQLLRSQMRSNEYPFTIDHQAAVIGPPVHLLLQK